MSIEQSLWRMMVLIRAVEDRIGELVAAGEIKTPCHLSIGQEAIPAGVCAALQPDGLRGAIVAWQGLGARVGLAHAGTRLRELPRLHALGVDYVRIDGAFVQGAATQAAVRELARGLVALLRGMQLQILAEAVQDADDLAALWALGFDGAEGPVRRPGA